MTQDNDQVFEEHGGAVYAWAYRLLGRHQDALDVVQDVFLKWLDQCRVSPPNHPRGWLRRATLNQAVDFIRRRRAHERAVEGRSRVIPAEAIAADSIRVETREPTASDHGALHGVDSDGEAWRRRVAEAMGELTVPQRTVLAAKVFDGMTFARIADEQSLSVSTVKTHYLRALRSLRDRLGGTLGD